MKVIFNKSDLIGALDRVQRAAQTKSHPIQITAFSFLLPEEISSSRPMITPSVSKRPVLQT